MLAQRMKIWTLDGLLYVLIRRRRQFALFFFFFFISNLSRPGRFRYPTKVWPKVATLWTDPSADNCDLTLVGKAFDIDLLPRNGGANALSRLVVLESRETDTLCELGC
jgi:hypothetical protein